jgi:hypothetical protein
LSGKNPFLQGWAIVDNAGDSDWKNVELSLIVGRPVSFTQPLYTPYFVTRPSLPLSIAGFAEAKSYEGGYQARDELNEAKFYSQAPMMMKSMAAADSSLPPAPNYDVPQSKSAGEHFVFTLKNPISVERRQSAMIPFVQSNIKTRKVSIFTHASQGSSVNPSLGVELTNNLGLKIPAGPIAVYEDGTFMGDALIDFFGQDEKRLISYGDDLAVKGTVSYTSESKFDSVKISRGVITITEKMFYEKIYTLKNSDKKDRNIILEHPFTANTDLITPAKYAEKTSSAYRFEFVLPANKELKYTVKETKPVYNTIRILDMDYSSVSAYSTNKEFPSSVRNALKEAARLMSVITNEKNRLSNAQTTLNATYDEQERIRSNIVTVGSGSVQGQEYIKKLTALDKEIDTINANISKIRESLQKAQKAFDDYVASLNI